jgi:hypothetical protein
MASKMPEWMMSEPRSCPFNSGGTRKACVMIVMMMTVILTNAKPLALASYTMLAKLSHWVLRFVYLCDISVQRKWVRDAKNEQNHDRPAISEQPKEGHVV